MTRTDFVVLGAGPAGLGAAYRLSYLGFRVIVLERQAVVGGLAGSFEFAGQRVDYGSHRLHAATPAPILRLLRARLGDELQQRGRRGRIRIRDRWLAFPPGPAAIARSLPPGFLVRAGLSAAVATVRPRRDRNFAEYVTTGLGRVMGEAFYFPYARKIWGVEPDGLSGEQARRRISADTPWKLARRVSARKQGGRFFYYPAGGFGRIPEVLAEAAVEEGADIRLSTEVAGIRFGDSSVTVATSGGDRIKAGQVWSTIPLTSLAELVETVAGDPTPGVAGIEYRAMLLVYLAVPSGRYTPFDAHYFPDRDIAMTRVSEPKNYRDGPDPPDRTVLCAEIPCSPSDDMWSRTDHELGAMVGDALARCGLEHPRPVEVAVRRLRFAYPVYRIGYEESLTPLIAWADRRRNLVTFGRQGLFAHDNTHHTLAMALAAADAVGRDGRLDHVSWEAARRSFDRHVVED
ncbi:protoporphyrinogen/coproporphyrinogen oxidase [Candidatus Spongiisocius sp.]|uniref:protoporphyrinogen/coproporphyrinogen oxidase n=1 Tax=Candidatus Spongiisocius sp. TaxID=3101273 RepID=UPI003B59E93A